LLNEKFCIFEFMVENTYIFKKFENNSYSDYTENLVTVSYQPLLYFTDLEDKYNFIYTTSQIPERTLELLNELLEYYHANQFRDEFTSLLVFLQSMYIDFEETFCEELIETFVEEDKEYNNLLNIIEKYLFVENNKLQAITFKFFQNDVNISPIKNPIVIEDIFKSICKNLEIDKNNFYEKKNEITEDSKLIRQDKGGDHVRMLVVNALFNFLKSNIIYKSESQLLKFCGYFLHLCQIPYNQKITEIQIENLQDGLDSIEPPILRNFIERPNQVFTK